MGKGRQLQLQGVLLVQLVLRVLLVQLVLQVLLVLLVVETKWQQVLLVLKPVILVVIHVPGGFARQELGEQLGNLLGRTHGQLSAYGIPSSQDTGLMSRRHVLSVKWAHRICLLRA